MPALSDAPGWCLEHNDLNFHNLYSLVINFFEDVRNPAKKAKRQDLLKWWNKYVIHIGPSGPGLLQSRQVFPHMKTDKASNAAVNTMQLLNGD